MTITDAAESVLLGADLKEKLTIHSIDLIDGGRSSGLETPSMPTRCAELKMSEVGVRATFPGVNDLENDRARGELLHFLANHELLAAELMALVLLKFPEAPDAYRRGVYEAMREEQMHTRMYLRRMKECGLEFGQLPLNSYFWRMVSPMKSPMEFVTKLNLTFEQANLDFSRHYADLFRRVGDTGTAAVLEKIYLDEISHVGHGITWFREWKSPNESDWNAFRSTQVLPFSASKAKGMAPFNPDGRRRAGLNEDFIHQLSVYQQSRGRNPVLHWCNTNAEVYIRAERLGREVGLNKTERSTECDLELVMMAACKNDDLLLVREMPSNEHLRQLKERGFSLPEFVQATPGCLDERKLGGLMPWAWSPDASAHLESFAGQVSPTVDYQWSSPLRTPYFSKQLGSRLEHTLEIPTESVYVTEKREAIAAVNAVFESERAVKLKGAYACSGRDQFIAQKDEDGTEKVIETVLAKHGGMVVEPLYDVLAEFSALYDLKKNGNVVFKGYSLMETTSKGQYRSSIVSKKWTNFLSREVREFLFRDAELESWYRKRIPDALAAELGGYQGPVGIDAFVCRDASGALALKHVLEVNTRYTMGRIALDFLKQRDEFSGQLSIQRAGTPLSDDQIPINDPKTAKVLQVMWTVL